MSEHESKFPTGNLKISRDVIATIAKTATMEIEGVDGFATFATNVKGFLRRKPSTKAIIVDLNDDIAVVHLNIVIKPGFRIPDIALKVQTDVKEAIQNMTGIAVSRVNVTIAGIQFAHPAGEVS